MAQRTRKDSGERLDVFEPDEYTCRAILTNDGRSKEDDVVRHYNLRGGKERILDQMNNDFGWGWLPKSEMAHNAVFVLLAAIIRNFYEFLVNLECVQALGISARTRMKAFVARLVAVPAKWIRRGRQDVICLYTDRREYIDLFAGCG